MALTSKLFVVTFRDSDGEGWSESHWYNGPTTQPSLQNNINDFIDARIGVLAASCLATHIRISSATKRDPFVLYLGGGSGIAGTEDFTAAPTEVALLLRYDATTGYNRLFLRGIPKRIIVNDDYSPDPAFSAVLTQFNDYLKNSALFNVVSRVGQSGTPVAITTIVPTPPRGYQFLAPSDVGDVGDSIRVTGAVVPGFNGRKVVRTKTAIVGGITYQVGGAAPPVSEPSTSVQATQLGINDLVINSYSIERLTTRKPGRPFGVLRGRRQTLYSLRR